MAAHIIPNTIDYQPPRDTAGNWNDRYPRLMVEYSDLMPTHIDRAACDERACDSIVDLIGEMYGSFAVMAN